MSTLSQKVQMAFPKVVLHKFKEQHGSLNTILSSEVGVDTAEPFLAKESAHVEEVKRLLGKLADTATIFFIC